ncbi:protoheme IX farnesyltransferase [Candidatus Magnetobacterium bavaricum]|uniref:Protoheme IX farnesyltransferase n=1 Tax=Candidatus Magnetobacterium bavaricum TaxID=29290 RepID=A0A0F3GWS4_9BACT|nr:protoheme IX farnesyltransferase [Candidatus Magnetobacterium bavaricum]
MIAKVIAYKTVVRDHLILAKPGIVLLVLIVALAGMYMGQRGLPSPYLVSVTLIAIGLATGGSAVLNNFIDRDIDRLMHRTMVRPIPQGRIQPNNALAFGLSLIAISICILLLCVNVISAALTLLSAFIYIIPYTLMMKKRTHLVTHVGSITGALPPVIGYTAVKAVIELEAVVMFAIMFLWQHPHFWAYAIKYKDDYNRAGIPVLPLSKGVRATVTKTLIYTIVLLPVSLLPYLLKMSGVFYLVLASVLGILYIALALKAYLSDNDNGKTLFIYSIVYISIVFFALVVDMVR